MLLNFIFHGVLRVVRDQKKEKKREEKKRNSGDVLHENERAAKMAEQAVSNPSRTRRSAWSANACGGYSVDILTEDLICVRNMAVNDTVRISACLA